MNKVDVQPEYLNKMHVFNTDLTDLLFIDNEYLKYAWIQWKE